MGMERLISMLKIKEEQNNPSIYFATIGDRANEYATKLVYEFRKKNIYCEKDISNRSLKAQFKYADKINAKYILTLGDDEMDKKQAKLKNMGSGEEQEVELDSILTLELA